MLDKKDVRRKKQWSIVASKKGRLYDDDWLTRLGRPTNDNKANNLKRKSEAKL